MGAGVVEWVKVSLSWQLSPRKRDSASKTFKVLFDDWHAIKKWETETLENKVDGFVAYETVKRVVLSH
jgi:hypothetical protein|tara:strand:+ start:577 stop:780 length:204 start_codon:yes stop_codon:yes gene_type:complete